jgi:hypothetical protein
MKNITAAISHAQYRATRVPAAIEPSRRTQNTTHRFRGVNKCDPPQPPQSQQLNNASATSHRITANV